VNLRAKLNGRDYGAVDDLYIGRNDRRIHGVHLNIGFLKQRTVPTHLFRFSGDCYSIAPSAKEDTWKPNKNDVIRLSRLKDKEVFAGVGWKIGRLLELDVDVKEWLVTSLTVDVEHQLLLRDVGSYRLLHEDTSMYDVKKFYREALSMRPGRIVDRMSRSDKAVFLSNSGDSNVRGLGESRSRVRLPSDGMKVHESGTITLPLNGVELERITVELIDSGALNTDEGRRDIARDIFRVYYENNLPETSVQD
jgi:sporulation protein YlmC with PRC-barrel domain